MRERDLQRYRERDHTKNDTDRDTEKESNRERDCEKEREIISSNLICIANYVPVEWCIETYRDKEREIMQRTIQIGVQRKNLTEKERL